MQVDTGRQHASLVLGTRGSALALRQADQCRDLLLRSHPALQVRIEVVQSRGDVERERPLQDIGGQGIFTAALEERLIAGDIDAAVHSAKDLPSRLTSGFVLAALPVRVDPRDCLLTRDGSTLADLPPGAVVGTSSPRRAAQLLAARPDLRPAPIRGNVDTRRRAVLEGRFDATVLAVAGLTRLGLLDAHAVPLPIDLFIPQAGQGALAVEARAADGRAGEWLSAIDDPNVRACVAAERAVLAGLAAGCQAPVAAYARLLDGGRLHLRALAASLDPTTVLLEEQTGPRAEAEQIGLSLAARMRAQGADDLLRRARRERA